MRRGVLINFGILPKNLSIFALLENIPRMPLNGSSEYSFLTGPQIDFFMIVHENFFSHAFWLRSHMQPS